MPESRNTTVAIFCHAPSAFVRAHLHALAAGETSVLVPNQDGRMLAELGARLAFTRVYSDTPQDPCLAGFEVAAVDALPQTREFPQAVPADHVITVLCTSGSTGQAKIIWKAYRAFAGESRALSQLFRGDDEQIRVVTTVPFEHMYGYQYGFFWPRFAGLEAPETRVVLPTDLKAELTRSDKPAWVVTTPTHMSAFAEAGLRVANVRRLFTATSPLLPRLAEAAQRCFGVAPIDIYGSTETGTIAWRECDGADSLWQCLPDRRLRARADGRFELICPHLTGPESISDVLELVPPRQFRILGRAAEMVKVAGKRTSLAALNSALLAAPGVRDGSYWLPEAPVTDSEVLRPVAFVVLREGASTQDVVDHLRTRVDPVFLPRPIFAVEDLGRNPVGKLPLETLRNLYGACVSRHAAERSV